MEDGNVGFILWQNRDGILLNQLYLRQEILFQKIIDEKYSNVNLTLTKTKKITI